MPDDDTNHPAYDRRITGIRDVAERRLCLGCGACAYMQPDAIRMVDVLEQGRRPLVLVNGDGRDAPTGTALRACPGLQLGHEPGLTSGRGHIAELLEAWGPVLEVWEGYAADQEIRYAASSGGAATALALHCLEQERMHGVLHTAARPDVPYLNHTVLSRSREELLAATGSRYAPASPCDGLQKVEDAPAPCVFIGKPCDVGGARKAASLHPELDRKLGLTIGIFCAGTPSLQGTLEMLRRMGVEDPDEARAVRYRGNGWPGMAEARTSGPQGDAVHRLSYEESWGEVLQRHVQWRCRLCVDHTAEFADIAVGDPWYREIPEGEPGRSLVLVRTERGRRILHAAIGSGALVLERVGPEIVQASQPNLLRTRGAVWGRLAASRLLGLPVPHFERMPTFGIWWRRLSLVQKAQSFTGTAKRVLKRRLHQRAAVVPYRIGEKRASRADERRSVRPWKESVHP